ncbi:hypothetical protein SAMN05443633_10628 [Chryseobacterium arachidis]|uniref:CHAP domain-containing protein n=1 Tax=Chryseobacterium arachidis TaxID=1416778 RepID=A0A1M5DWP1_9FLAO|nr:hypothetical protein [Chryseobacterium arachidis]SHF71262.1 hypothetical protein SAMN05443633_10628 [Chryseobacterium arachidis]
MRQIKPALFTIVDKKLKENGAAQKAIEEKDARSLLVYAAEACVGETEEGKDNYGTFVELCQKTVDNEAKGESWCMGFVQSMISYVETKLEISSPVATSENCLKVWKNTHKSKIVKQIPKRGAIAIWRDVSNSQKLDSPIDSDRKIYKGKGHTGFVLEYDYNLKVKTMKTVEGNTNVAGSGTRDGVFRRNDRKKKRNIGKLRSCRFYNSFLSLNC